jgi:amino acid transporter
MNLITIALIVIFLLFVVLISIGVRYPRGRLDWPLDRKNSVSILISVFVFLLLLILSFYVSQQVEWPANTTIIFYVGIIIFGILVVISIILPKGFTDSNE